MFAKLRWLFHSVLFLTVLTTSLLMVITLFGIFLESLLKCHVLVIVRIAMLCMIGVPIGALVIDQAFDLAFRSSTFKSDDEKP